MHGGVPGAQEVGGLRVPWGGTEDLGVCIAGGQGGRGRAVLLDQAGVRNKLAVSPQQTLNLYLFGHWNQPVPWTLSTGP